MNVYQQVFGVILHHVQYVLDLLQLNVIKVVYNKDGIQGQQLIQTQQLLILAINVEKGNQFVVNKLLLQQHLLQLNNVKQVTSQTNQVHKAWQFVLNVQVQVHGKIYNLR